MRRLVLVLIALLAAAPAAAASSARPVAHDAPAFPVTNGRDVAAYADDSGLHIVRDGRPDGAEPPNAATPGDGCRLGGVNATDAAFLCPLDNGAYDALKLVSLSSDLPRTARVSPAIEAYTSATANSEFYKLNGFGDHVARIDVTGVHVDNSAWFRLDPPFEPALNLLRRPAGTVIDLDAPGGVRKVCGSAGQTTRLLYRAPWVLSIHGARVFLRRCGTRTAKLVGSASGTTAVLTSRYAAWVTNEGYDVAIRMLATGKTYKIATTPLVIESAALPHMAATAHRLWLGDERGHARVVEVR
jgi:hypothetical protein